MPWSHLLLAVAVVAVWGSNFVVIRLGLDVLPPLLFALLRFAFAFVPACLFLPRPAVPWRQLAAYGLLIGGGQFGLLYVALRADISPGLASLVVQTQVFFTIGLAMWLDGERPRRHQVLGLALALAGLCVIGLQAWADAAGGAARGAVAATPLGLLLVLGAAAAWAGGNVVARRAGRVDMLAYVVWSSAFALPPLALLSWWLEGPVAVGAALASMGPGTWAAVLWQSVGNTLFGYAAWAWLLARHPAAQVAPLALLVPVFGMGSSAVLLGEPLQAWKLLAAALVLGGLALNVFWPRLRDALRGGSAA